MLGYVGIDDNGLGGLEQKFDTRLHGTPGAMLTAIDARRHVLGSIEHEPQPGQNLQLTIDENIQFMAESALDHVMEKTHADNGTIVVQDVHTGQILALAIRPTFNPNDFRHTTSKLLKNHAVSDVYEPGSVFKLVTYSSAIDAQVAKPDDMVDCQGGQITLAGRVIHDDKSDRGLGVVTVATALAKSSDVAAVKMALKVGPTASINTFATSALAAAPASNSPVKPAASCVLPIDGMARRLDRSRLARKSASHRSSSCRWCRPSRTAERVSSPLEFSCPTN